MEAQARPQDLLLAYDADFIGFSSNEMAQPLEPVSFLAAPEQLPTTAFGVGVLGGTPDPDGYYEDFTARLAALSQRFHRGRQTKTGGADLPALDWGALVLSVDTGPPGETDSEGEEPDDKECDSGPGVEESRAREPGVKEPRDVSRVLERHAVEVAESEDAAPGATGGTSPVIPFSDFIVEAEGGTAPRNDALATPEEDVSDREGGPNDAREGYAEDTEDTEDNEASKDDEGDGGARGESGVLERHAAEVAEGEDAAPEATGGTSPVIPFSDFIVEAEGGTAPRKDNLATPEEDATDHEGGLNDAREGYAEDNEDNEASEDDEGDEGAGGDRAAHGGEMDETGEEIPFYEIVRAIPLL